MPAENYSEFVLRQVASGIIYKFRNYEFNTSETISGFGTCRRRVLSTTINTPAVQDGFQQLAGGRLYSPWAVSGTRAPVTWPRFVQSIEFYGDVQACLRRHNELQTLIGMTLPLHFTWGRRTYNPANYFDTADYGNKYCPAMLLSAPVTFDLDLTQSSPAYKKTRFIVTATWQQAGEFAPE